MPLSALHNVPKYTVPSREGASGRPSTCPSSTHTGRKETKCPQHSMALECHIREMTGLAWYVGLLLKLSYVRKGAGLAGSQGEAVFFPHGGASDKHRGTRPSAGEASSHVGMSHLTWRVPFHRGRVHPHAEGHPTQRVAAPRGDEPPLLGSFIPSEEAQIEKYHPTYGG